MLGCRKCGKCDSICDTGALIRIDGIAQIDNERCNLCLRCAQACPNKAIRLLE